jgi:two-component system phosphate regulon sensor histidine kinase PhoR
MKRGETDHEAIRRGPRFGRRHRVSPRSHENKFRPAKKWVLIGIISIHVGIAISWGLAYMLMGWIYRTWFPEIGHNILRQYLTVVLTVTITFVLMNIIRLTFSPIRRQMNWFMLMIDAMKRLSKGDFSVSLESNPRYMGQFGPLVTSFNEMASELNQMEQMRQEFISNVSHEIQSPLTSITGFAKALQSNNLPPETRQHYLEIIETESKRLSKMSDNLLKLTSLESKHQPFEPKPYRMDRQLRRIILSCEPLWQDKNIEMDVDMAELTITADEDLMNQVWINLLHNSIKFTPEGGKIRIQLAMEDNHIRIDIADNGIGIAEEALPHLFERFYKADKARDRSGSGSGLGLSIVKKIIDIHEGEVYVQSRPNEGTAFTVVLPREPHSN